MWWTRLPESPGRRDRRTARAYARGRRPRRVLPGGGDAHRSPLVVQERRFSYRRYPRFASRSSLKLATKRTLPTLTFDAALKPKGAADAALWFRSTREKRIANSAFPTIPWFAAGLSPRSLPLRGPSFRRSSAH